METAASGSVRRRPAVRWAINSRATLAIPARAEALAGLGALLLVTGAGDVGRCSDLLEEALELTLRLNDGDLLSRARFFLAELATARGEVDSARELYEAVLEWGQASHTPVAAAWCHHNLGWIAITAGDPGRARTHFERGLDAVALGHDDVVIPHLLGSLATVTAAAGEFERAETLADEAVTMARAFSLRGILLMALTRAAEAAILSDTGSQAEMRLRDLLRLLQELGARRWVAGALEMASLVRHRAAQDEAAARLLGAAAPQREAFGVFAGGIQITGDGLRMCRDRVAEALGADEFAEQQAQGRKMSVEEALSYALAELA